MAPAQTTTILALTERRRDGAVAILEEGDAGDLAAGVGVDPFDHGAGDEFAEAGREGAGQHGVLRAVLAVGRAGEADAGAALDAGGAAVARHGVDQQRRSEGVHAEASAPRFSTAVVALAGTGGIG